MVTRVYLDQWVWVGLARVAHGQKLPDESTREPLEQTLAIARHGVEAGLLSFPLSTSHYIETQRRYSADSRYKLATVMAALSRFDVIVSCARLFPGELDRELRARFGRPQNVRSVDVFGRGIAYAFGKPELAYRLPEEVPIPPELRLRAQATISEGWEFAALAGPDNDEAYRHSGPGDGESWIAYEEEVARRLREAGFAHKPDQFLTAIEWTEMNFMKPLYEACVRAGIDYKTMLTSLDRASTEEFLLSLPTRGTIHRIRREQHKSSRKRRGSDVHDMEALGVAVVHCDVVVAERYHGELLRRTGADKRFGTRVITALSELPAALVSASAKRAG